MRFGLKWTILQPSQFLDQFPLAMLMEQEMLIFKAPYNLNPFSFSVLGN